MRLGAATRGPQRGVALLEWMVAHSLGLVVVAAATSLFLHQARVAMALHQRQLQLQDLGVVAQVLPPSCASQGTACSPRSTRAMTSCRSTAAPTQPSAFCVMRVRPQTPPAPLAFACNRAP